MKTEKCDCDVRDDKSAGHFGDCALIVRPTHTPTPWTIAVSKRAFVTEPVMREVLDAAGGPAYQSPVSYPIGKCETEADAAFIVRAVNAHDELLAALKLVRDCTLSESGARSHMTLRVDQAIAKAEGR